MYTLKLLRTALGLTQAEVGERTGVQQGEVSKLEARETLDDVRVSTLRRYAKALGGEMQLVVVIDGRRYVLAG